MSDWWYTSDDTGSSWRAPVTVTRTDTSWVAEISNSTTGVFGVGHTRAQAIADLREAIRDFVCVMGVVRCEKCREEK